MRRQGEQVACATSRQGRQRDPWLGAVRRRRAPGQKNSGPVRNDQSFAQNDTVSRIGSGPVQNRTGPHPNGANPGQNDPDSGQTTIVLIGFALVTLLLVVTVLAITSVYVGQRQLQSLADRAAGAAADTFTTVDRSGSGPPTPVLTNDGVSGAAASYLGTVGAFHDVSGLAVGGPTGSVDGTTAQVTLTAVVHPPVVNVIVPAGVPISATGDARAVMRR